MRWQMKSKRQNEKPQHLPALQPMLPKNPKGLNGGIKITEANAEGPRQLTIRMRWAARVAQFYRRS